MAKKSHESQAGRTLEEIQSAADSMGDWIRLHFVQVLGTIAALLLAAGGGAYISNSREAAADAAAAELAAAREDYLQAMGAGRLSIDVPELANPAAAEPIRAEFRTALEQISNSYPDSTAAVLSRFEAGRLAQEGGDAESALEVYRAALGEEIENPTLRALAQQRVAQALEDLERWSEAADAHELAAGETSYPLRHWALADAARCRATAGDYPGAQGLYERLEAEAPALQLAGHERSLRTDTAVLATR